MNEDTLYELLQGLEWKDLELKESRTEVPESVYETVSAFLNTEGGHIVLGVNDKREIVGILDVDKIQGNFIGELKNPARFGVSINFDEFLKTHEDKNVLIFYIPEAQRKDKPVYVKTKKKGRIAFIRKGGGDYACNKTDLDRMINDALKDRPDGKLLDLDTHICFDAQSITWFRNRYEHKGGNRSLVHLSDSDFLTELGLLVEQKGQLLPTLASVLLLGKTSYVRQLMPRPIVDCLRYSFAQDHANTGKRWDKRITCEYNIVQTWQAIVDWYNSLAETPFKLDKESGQRSDFPPDFIAFREAVINLLSHQDLTDQTRWPVIEDYSDLTRFWNPGDAFANADKLLEPGAKEVRNPILVRALRDIGFSEQSGWGLRDVYRNWHELGRVPPELNNDKVEKAFELKLNRKILMSEQQILMQSQIGIHLKPEEAAAFANLCSTDNAQITINALRAALGLNGYDTEKIVQRLIIQGVVIRPTDHQIALAEHLMPLKTQILGNKKNQNEQVDSERLDLSTEQVDPLKPDLFTEQVTPLTSLTDKQRALLKYCDVPRTMAEIMEHLKVGSRGYLKDNHVVPLLNHSLLAMTNPEKPRASNQRYVITELGAELKQSLVTTQDK
jgi:ATP-dependent DNA helicase RecG